jgi:glucosylceramidase
MGPALQPPASSRPVQVWLTTIDQRHLLERQPDLAWSRAARNSGHFIKVDARGRHQRMDGFGASITDSSAFLLQKRLAPNARAEVMRDLFGRDGIHVSMVRQPMGSCDYSMNLRTYDDEPGDTSLTKFSIERDKHYILPSLREALSVNPELKVMATPWSAPGWMKSSGSIIGGGLKPEYEQVYADYFARFLEAYRDQGVPVFAITLQNEPLFTPTNYPGGALPASEAADFVKKLGPTLQEHHLNPSILIYDHNWDHPEYPLQVLDDPEAARWVSGVAWHGYGGSPTAMARVLAAHPDKRAYFTESSGGEWVPAFHDAFMDQIGHVISTARNGSSSLMWWNLALDPEHGPCILGDESTCRGLITIDQKTGRVEKNLDYYTLGHISKLVEPGATRVDSVSFDGDLEDVAFQNPDGSTVLIVSNRLKKPQVFAVQEGGRSLTYTLPTEAAATLKW